MYRKLLPFLTALLMLSSQVYAQTWKRNYTHYYTGLYGLHDADYISGNGGVILRGDDSSGYHLITAVGINNVGDSIWEHSYPDSFSFHSVAAMPNGGAIYAGFAQTSFDYGVGTYLLNRLDANGNIVFQKSIYSTTFGVGPGVYDFDLPKVVSTSNNEYYFVYAKDSFANFGLTDTMFFRTYIEKYDANNNLLWTTVNEKHYHWYGVGIDGLHIQGKSIKRANNGLFYSMFDEDPSYTTTMSVEARDASGNILFNIPSGNLMVNEAGYYYHFQPVENAGGNYLVALRMYPDSWGDTLHKQKIVALNANGVLVDSVTLATQDTSLFNLTYYCEDGVGTSNNSYMCVAWNNNGINFVLGINKYDANLDFVSFTPYPFGELVQQNVIHPNDVGGAFLAYLPTNGTNITAACNFDSLFHTFPGLIEGDIIKDNNSNCVNDGGDDIRKWKAVVAHEQGGTDYFAMSLDNGHYQINLPAGSYDLSHSIATYYNSVCPSTGIYSYNVTNTTNISNAHFFDTLTQNIKDLSVTMALGACVPGFDADLNIFVMNNGTTTESGVLTIDLDNNLTYLSAVPTPQSVTGNVLTFNISNLAPEDATSFVVHMNNPTTLTLGTTLNFAAALPLVNDTTPGNNDDSLFTEVVGSFDPNQKTANRPLQMHAEDEILYTVEFQNTGTYYATNVVIEDTISTNLDLLTFKMMSTSHTLSKVELLDGRRMRFSFNNIYLPDSNTNEPGSHGKFIFSIKPNKYINTGEEIFNTAHIYFDFNSAIVTNTTHNIIADNPYLEVANIERADNIVLFPNPADGKNVNLLVPAKAAGKWTVNISDITGKQISSKEYASGSSLIVMNLNIPEGVYLVQIQNRDEYIKVTKKLVIQK